MSVSHARTHPCRSGPCSRSFPSASRRCSSAMMPHKSLASKGSSRNSTRSSRMPSVRRRARRWSARMWTCPMCSSTGRSITARTGARRPISARWARFNLARLSALLTRGPDRIGNLMIAGADDAVSCDLHTQHDRALRLKHVDSTEQVTDTYRATVWASHSGDEVLRREILVPSPATEIDCLSAGWWRRRARPSLSAQAFGHAVE